MSKENVQIVRTACMMCHGGCGIRVHLKDGKTIKIEGDKDCPNNKGDLCPKGKAILEHIYHPDRLKYPLKRVSARGEGKWERISWDEATDIIARKIMEISRQYGPEAIAAGDGTRGAELAWTVDFFGCVLGTPNTFGSGRAQCFTPRVISSEATYGRYHGPDYESGPQCIVLWGDQPNVSNHNTIVWPRLKEALIRKPKPKLIVIDPRKTAMASRADIWLRLRPGTDAALLLAWINVIIEEKLYDDAFVKKWTNAPYLVRLDNNYLLRNDNRQDRVLFGPKGGWDRKEAWQDKYLVWDLKTNSPADPWAEGIEPALEGTFTIAGVACKPVWQILKERAQDYTPEKVADIVWVEANLICEAARTYVQTKPACIAWGVGIDQAITTHQNARAICILQAITGNVDVPGGNVFHPPSLPGWHGVRAAVAKTKENIPPEVWDKQLGAETYRLFAGNPFRNYCHNPTLLKAIITGKPYPIKALLIHGANMLLGWPNSKQVYEALKKVDFLVVADIYMNPTAQLADIVLPAATNLEKSRLLDPLHGVNRVGNVCMQKVIEPLGEARDDFDMFKDILNKCGLGDKWPWKNVEQFYDELLRKAGTSWEQVVAEGGLWDRKEYKKYETEYYRPGKGFDTPTGKVEVYSVIWKELGYDPLPFYLEPAESPYSTPELAKEYPYVLTTGGRIPYFFHTQFLQVPSLRKRHPFPRVEINPETARQLGINEGDWVLISSPRGSCIEKAKLSNGLDPRVVHAEHGWWYPEMEPKEPDLSGAWLSNINILVPNEPPFLDQGFGGCTIRGFLCKVERLPDDDPRVKEIMECSKEYVKG